MRLDLGRVRRNASSLAIVGSVVGTVLAFAPTPANAGGLGLTLCPPLPASVCTVLGGGGGGGGGSTPTLPTGVSTSDPTSFGNDGTAQGVTITDPLAQIYSTLTSGVTVALVGPGSSTSSIPGSVGTISGSSIPVTFDLAPGGLPVGPGTYSIHITPAVTSGAGLGTLLGGLGLTSLPVDTVSVTVTAGLPMPNAQLSVAPGSTTDASITTLATPFASGDAVSFTTPTGTAVPGLSLQNPAVSAASITGTLNADSSVAPGKYDLLVTDTAGQVGTCQDCVTVTSARATTLTLVTSRAKVVGGQATTMHGRLTADGAGLQNSTIYLLTKTTRSKVHVLKAVQTSSTGTYAYTFKPTQNSVFAAFFLGDSNGPGDAAALSKIVGVSVSPKLVLHVKTIRVAGHRHGARMLLTGRTNPAEHGSTVTLYNHGKRFGVAKVTSKGTFRLVKRLVRRGHYVLRGKTTSHPAFAAAQSAIVRTTVR